MLFPCSVSTEAKVDISGVQQTEQAQVLRTVLRFLENMEAKDAESEKHYEFANKLDKIYAWLYFILGTIYFFCMFYVMVKYKCTINHFDFWY